MHTFTEENYLKAVYKLQESPDELVSTNAVAEVMGVHAPSVTDMLKRLAGKKLVIYQKSRGFKLTEKGRQLAVKIIRSHRLWEVFLVEKLGFGWDEVHDLAEELEHIHNEYLVNKLDAFLGYPKKDPHGDLIPDAKGVMPKSKSVLLATVKPGEQGILEAVTDDSPAFLSYLDKTGLSIGDLIKVKFIEEFDQSFTLQLRARKEISISYKVASSLLISA